MQHPSTTPTLRLIQSLPERGRIRDRAAGIYAHRAARHLATSEPFTTRNAPAGPTITMPERLTLWERVIVALMVVPYDTALRVTARRKAHRAPSQLDHRQARQR